MNQAHARYDAYKDSGVVWLGEVPAHWASNRHKDVFHFVSIRCANSSLLKVGLENIEGKTGRFITTDSEFEGDGVEFKKDDILFGKLRPYLAKVYQAEFNGNAVGDIFVYRPRWSITPHFAQYLMLSDSYIDVINSSTAGAKMPRVSSNFIANLPVSTPSIAEQTAIAAYLDANTAQLDRKIELLVQKAAQYGKLKQSLISEAVTRGLDKSVAMKNSGVEWLGEVPAHWEVKRVRDVANVINGFPFDSDLFDLSVGIPLIRIRDLNKSVANTYYKGNLIATAVVTDADVLIGMDGDFNVGRWYGKGEALLNQRVCCVRSKRDLVTKLIEYSLPFPLQIINHLTNATTVKHLSSNQIEKIFISFPPDAGELAAIIAYLDSKTTHIDRIVATLNSQIDKLRELRKTLINDIVTGKIKVA